MRYKHTQIFQRTYQLVLLVYQIVSNFKREHKFSLGEKLKDICLEILDLVVLANLSRDKVEVLDILERKLETLRIHLRLATDLRIVSLNHIGNVTILIEDIGKQIGGWKKWSVSQSVKK